MSSPLSKELRQKYNVRSMPIRKDDEVQVRLPQALGVRTRVTLVPALPKKAMCAWSWGSRALRTGGSPCSCVHRHQSVPTQLNGEHSDTVL